MCQVSLPPASGPREFNSFHIRSTGGCHMAKTPLPTGLDASAAARLLGVDAKTITAAAEWFGPAKDGRWPLVAIVQGFIRYQQDRHEYATASEVAAEIGITTQRFDQLVREFRLPAPARKDGTVRRFKRAESILAFCTWIRSNADRKNTGANERMRNARSADLEVRTRLRLRELVPRSEAGAVCDDIVGYTRTEMGIVPARVTRDLSLRATIQSEIDGGLARVADRLAQRAEELKAGLEDDQQTEVEEDEGDDDSS
jgi:hypothetical protein